MKMKKKLRSVAIAAGLALAAFGGTQLVNAESAPERPKIPLKPVANFAGIKDEHARSIALFQEAGKVIMHPRCLNCHPPDNSPRQGDDMRVHQPPVQRGAGGMGVAGMRCITCHGQANFDPAHVPGHPKWLLAPIEMAWIGKSLGEICVQLKDQKRNGGRTLEQIVEHMTHDSLVGWGWHPDAGRSAAPGTQEEFGALFKAWMDTGAQCPKS